MFVTPIIFEALVLLVFYILNFFNGYLDSKSLIFLIVLKDKTSCWILVDTFYFVERNTFFFFFKLEVLIF